MRFLGGNLPELALLGEAVRLNFRREIGVELSWVPCQVWVLSRLTAKTIK